MKIVVTLHTWDYRGDHSADVTIAQEVRPGETIDELARRLLGGPMEHIEIRRIVEEIEPVPTGGGWPEIKEQDYPLSRGD